MKSHIIKYLFLSLLFLISTTQSEESNTKPNEETDDRKSYGTVIGIDLGTTYSCVGIYQNGRVEIIANDQGSRITPSYVAFTEDERLVGESAKNQAASNPENTIYDAKRLIGRKFSDSTVKSDLKLLPFKIKNKNGKAAVEVNIKNERKTLLPEEISAMVLGKMKNIAEAYLGKNVTHAVVTVPAYFNDAQRKSTQDAGRIAGLNVIRIINEPTAAAIAYGLDKKSDERNIIVYDLGGGTFDVSLLTIDDGVFEVLSTNGNTHLGGEDFDHKVVEYFVSLFKTKHKKDLSKNKKAIARLRREVEKAKRALSSTTQVRIEIDSIIDNMDFSETLTRAMLEKLNMKLFRKTLEPLRKVLKDAGKKKSDIHEVVLVGGSTRIPKIQELVRTFFNGKEPHRGINPDEAVAYGAAVQAGILSGESDDKVDSVLLIDVTPLSLGIETVGGVFTKIIEKSTAIPTKKAQIFSTYQDNQESVEIKVYQGERSMTKDNMFLNKFSLTGIQKAMRGEPQLEVTFQIDVNGVLNVSATNKQTGKHEHLVIENKPLSDEEIETMINNANQYEEEDRIKKEKILMKNELESYTYKVSSEVKKKREEGDVDEELLAGMKDLESAIEEINVFLKENPEPDKEESENKKNELEKLFNEVMSHGSASGEDEKSYYDEDGDDGEDHEEL